MSKTEDLRCKSSKKLNTRASNSITGGDTNDSPFEILRGATEQLNPAIILAEQLMRKNIAEVLDLADIDLARETLRISRLEIKTVEAQFRALSAARPTAGSKIPIGF